METNLKVWLVYRQLPNDVMEAEGYDDLSEAQTAAAREGWALYPIQLPIEIQIAKEANVH